MPTPNITMTRLARGSSLPGRRPNSEIHSASSSAVNAVAAIVRCCCEARSPISRSGASDAATNSSPVSAPATVVLDRKKLV